jgi:hypothetical protein
MGAVEEAFGTFWAVGRVVGGFDAHEVEEVLGVGLPL